MDGSGGTRGAARRREPGAVRASGVHRGKERTVVKVTRLDGSQFYVNADMIEAIEATPDTVLSLTTQHKLIVRDSPDEVVERVIAYQRRVHAGPVVVPAGLSREGGV
jgi:flagellar protein FlbD